MLNLDYRALRPALSAAVAVIAWQLFLSPAAAQGIQSPEGDAGPQQSKYEKIWNAAELYNSDENSVLQSVVLTGRFQYEYAAVSADEGSHHEWNVRRLRAGAKTKWFRTLTFHGEVEINPRRAGPVYTRITDLYVQWSDSDALRFTVGKHGVPFTMDGSTSSKELLTIDRSNLSNNMWFPQEYIPGVSIAGDLSGWTYHAGVYSAGEANREFGEFNGGVMTLASAGYNFAKAMGADEAILAGSYVYQSPHANNTFTRRLQHVVSVNFQWERENWGIRSDVTGAAGSAQQSDLWGIMAMPFFDVTEAFQVVGRYTYIESAESNGVQLGTYENRVVAGRGDRYNEMYVGANYYFYGHKLKLQSGLQLAGMNDRAGDGGAYSGASWTTGIRVSW